MVWQLSDAKNRLSEVLAKAKSEGPQIITSRGREQAVVLSTEEYARLKQPRQNFVESLRQIASELPEDTWERDKSLAREVDL